jgi:DNA-binding transcriptional MerR regulator
MKMEKRTFRIGELADSLQVERFVIRFWEKEFGITSTRSLGGQRFYTHSDIKKFALIKQLLYTQGFTIAGAKKYLRSTKQIISAVNIGQFSPSYYHKNLPPRSSSEKISSQIIELQKQLVKLRELL